MRWYEKLYVGEKAKKHRYETIQAVRNGRPMGFYVLTPAAGERNLLDIYPALTLKLPYYEKQDLLIVGIAADFEDAAAKAMKNGYAVYYAADARVIHSHNYTASQQFHRNFDLAISQADNPDVFSGIRSEGEGIRMVKDTARWLVKTGHAYLVPKLVVDSGFKYLGYLAGKRYKKLPRKLAVKLSMNRNYWK